MDTAVDVGVIRQHLIDPEICIRCNTCEATCPVNAITHDDNNYVVKADVCNGCMACISPCPTGSIDNWRIVPIAKAYTIEEQCGWNSLPDELSADQLSAAGIAAEAISAAQTSAQAEPSTDTGSTTVEPGVAKPAGFGATVPPWSAAHAYSNLFGPKAPAVASVVGNFNCTETGFASETHHVVLDLGSVPFPVLEGQSIGIIPPGVDSNGRPHVARQYSIASPRNGERPDYNNISLTVKRVTENYAGEPVRGVASNYLCDLKVGDKVQIIGPFGTSFLMPNHPKSHIVMICTGTGSAPMRAMTEWRRRLRKGGKFEGGKLMLFFGARTQQELPYFGPLKSLPKDFIDINLAFSRRPDRPKQYVQHLMRERAADLAVLLKDPNTHIYVCGLKGMEEGVILALRDIANESGTPWEVLGPSLQRGGRLHLETY
jgi:benzoyl-CoA 2,3-dioxygenase component A